jgi:hypothetical protein
VAVVIPAQKKKPPGDEPSGLVYPVSQDDRYRAGPVFAGAPPCPVVLGADCVVLGPVAVDDAALRFHNASAATTISKTTTKAPMPHAARKPESPVALGPGSVTRMPHRRRRGGSVVVIGSLSF